MNSSCAICQELITSTHTVTVTDADVSVVRCGHVFHTKCINVWLGRTYKSKTCPQCRQDLSLKDVIKLNFKVNHTITPVDITDPLQIQLDNVQFQLRLKHMDIDKYHDKYAKATMAYRGLTEMMKELQHKAQNDSELIIQLKNEVASLENSEINMLKSENCKLIEKLQSLEDIKQSVDSNSLNSDSDSNEEVVEIKEPMELVNMVIKLKQELMELKEINNEIQTQIVDLKNNQRKYNENLNQENIKFIEMNEKLKEQENEKKILKRQIKELKQVIPEKKSKSNGRKKIK